MNNVSFPGKFSFTASMYLDNFNILNNFNNFNNRIIFNSLINFKADDAEAIFIIILLIYKIIYQMELLILNL